MDAIDRKAVECCEEASRTPAAACVEALQDGRLRRLLFFDLLLLSTPCVIEGAATSENTVVYRVAGEGVAIHGTVFLIAPERGRFDVAFGPGHPPFDGNFTGFQDLFEKLANCLNIERHRLRGELF